MRSRFILGLALTAIAAPFAAPPSWAQGDAPPAEVDAPDRPLDDIDALLAEMRESSGAEGGSGSSVRARRDLEVEDDEPDPFEVIAVVESVKRQRFPLVLVGVVVQSAAQGARVQPNDHVVVLPHVRSRRGVIDPADEQSKLNIGAWYVRPGDRVRLRLEPRPEDQPVWIAQSFERLTTGEEGASPAPARGGQ